MLLSVVIVNYNVRHFLENCLRTCLQAIEGLDAEIIVVDNGSKDGSKSIIPALFPQVRYHYSHQNLGFSKANNLAIGMASGEFVLLLNPDTLVSSEAISQCLRHFVDYPSCGACGVRMVDGAGTFLPESKRGLPTPWSAFYKLSGLSALAPRSPRFNAYHQGHLNQHDSHEVEVLSGAFIVLRRSVLDKIGLLDEAFFMYGEDIDLSHRIVAAGFSNWYLAAHSIVHYKGESTKKHSLHYVKVFYSAMAIFAQKHFAPSQALLVQSVIRMAIYGRATVSVVRQLWMRVGLLITDAALSAAAFGTVASVYSEWAGKQFTEPFIAWAIPGYGAVLAFSLMAFSASDKPFLLRRFIVGWFAGLAILLVVYAMLPEHLRFSRAVLLVGAALSAGLSLGVRWLWQGNQAFFTQPHRVLFVGSASSFAAYTSFRQRLGQAMEFAAAVAPSDSIVAGSGYAVAWPKLPEAVRAFRANAVVFSLTDCTPAQIISGHEWLSGLGANLSVFNAESEFQLGSGEVQFPPEMPEGQGLRELHMPAIRRSKWLFNALVSIVLAVVFPLAIWFIDNKRGFAANWWAVVLGKKWWIGLDERGQSPDFPPMKQGVVHRGVDLILADNQRDAAYRHNAHYLRTISAASDLRVLFRHFHRLGG